MSGEPKNDPNYVRWVPQLVEDVDGEKAWKPLKSHPCNETDFAQFYKVAKRSEKRLQELKDTDALICLDDLQEHKIEVYGEDEHTNFQRLEFLLLPCIEDLKKGICVNRTLE